jgi:hypothetical protein
MKVMNELETGHQRYTEDTPKARTAPAQAVACALMTEVESLDVVNWKLPTTLLPPPTRSVVVPVVEF